MPDFIAKLFKSDFLPHGYCYRWQSDVVWLHVVSDLLIALAYYFIPFALVYIVRKRRDLAYPWMFVLFGVFILACGTTHLMSIWVVWQPVYRLDGFVKAITAIASVPTAILLVRLAPAIIALPSPAQLRQEVAERKAAEQQVRELNTELERRVEERTRELEDANRQLRESENKLQAILDTSPVFVFVKGLDHRYQFVNCKFEDAFGIRREDVIGKTDFDLFPAEIAQSLRDLDNQVAQTREPREEEERVLQHGKLHTCISTKFLLYDHSGAPYGLCGISTDITDRKATEEALKRSNAELQQFAYIAAHDLQEPLRTVKSYTQLLVKRYGTADAEGAEFARFVTGGVDRMYALINDLQAYSELAQRRAPSEPTDVNDALRQTLASLQLVLEETGAKVEAEALPKVSVHESQLVQLLQNLMTNAIKYRGSDPPRIEIRAAREEMFWRFSVKDNGIGFDMRYAEQIFGLFKRLHSSQHYPGTGLGLAICKKIVEGFGGRIWATSEPGVGSTFFFTLPA